MFYKDTNLYRAKDITSQYNVCQCKSNSEKTNKENNLFKNTTCSEDAFRRGSGQKVIGFSFYEPNDKNMIERKHNKSYNLPPYFKGIEKKS